MRRIVAIFALGMTAAVARGQELTLQECVASLLPRPEEEKWLQIPWRLDLLKARHEANELGKPIFMWIMNGDPLGCT
jgi:hypothetical protein